MSHKSKLYTKSKSNKCSLDDSDDFRKKVSEEDESPWLIQCTSEIGWNRAFTYFSKVGNQLSSLVEIFGYYFQSSLKIGKTIEVLVFNKFCK